MAKSNGVPSSYSLQPADDQLMKAYNDTDTADYGTTTNISTRDAPEEVHALSRVSAAMAQAPVRFSDAATGNAAETERPCNPLGSQILLKDETPSPMRNRSFISFLVSKYNSDFRRFE